MLELNTEILAIIIGSVGSVITFFTLLWKKFISPLIKLVKNHDIFIKSVDHLRELMEKELKTNGGNSLKDAIIDMRATCNRIENRQKIIEQRTKAALHYSNVALFETDPYGRLIWSNVHLGKYFDKNHQDIEGYDWLNIIEEHERTETLQEFQSCLNMNRKFSKITTTQSGNEIRMLGYPYKLSDDSHGGFLVSITENEV